MKKISDRSRKIITYTIFLLLTLLFTKMCTYPPLSHNPQQGWCKIQAHEYYTKEERSKDLYSFLRKKAFVKVDGEFVSYNRSLHSDYERAFIECDGCNIHLSNSNSNGYPCTLTKKFYRFYELAFIIFFLFLHLVIYPLIKSKNQKQKENKVTIANKFGYKVLFKKMITYTILLLLVLFFNKMFVYQDFKLNAQGEYCEIQAEIYSKEERLRNLDSFLHKKSFVEIDGKLVPYNHSLHGDYEFAFVECDNCDIYLSNSKSVDGSPCIITRNFYNLYITSSIIYFLFFYFVICPLINTKKSTTTGK